MNTVDEAIKDLTIQRLRVCGGSQRRTAKSLGIGVRTLGLWVKKWKAEGSIPVMMEIKMKAIRAKRAVTLDVGVGPQEKHTIHKGAVGVLSADGSIYTFKNEDVVGSIAGEIPAYEADLIIRQHGEHFETVEEAGQATPQVAARTDKPNQKLTRIDLSSEAWREYTWMDPATGKEATKRFENPEAVYLYKGCTTHRVITKRNGKDVGTLVPAIGLYGCTVTWEPKEGQPIVVA